MFDIGWTELLVIAIVLIVVVGPKDLPPMIRAFGKMTANLRKMAGDFRTQFDEALRETELDDVRKTLSEAQKLNPTNALREAMNPLRQMGQDIKADLQRATQVPTPAADPVVTQTDIEAQQAVEGSTAEGVTPEIPPIMPAPTMPVTAAPIAAATAAAPVSASDVKPKAPRKSTKKVEPAAEVAVADAEKPKRARAARPEAAASEIADVVPAAEIPAKAPRKRAPKKTDAPKDEA